MKLFLDTADIAEISKANETGMIEGVTTNPSLIKKSGGDPIEVVKEIASTFSKLESISAEVVADTAEEMIDQAHAFEGIWNVTIKVPCTVEGLKACLALTVAGYNVNVTLVFSVAQAILAHRAGAKYVSPFVGRLDDNSFDGVNLIGDISKTFGEHFTTTQILGASIRQVPQVGQCFMKGANICTIPSKVFWGMYKHILTDQGLSLFDRDWKEVQSHL